MHIKYKGLCKEKLKSGNIRWRVRVRGDRKRKITLPVGPDHDEFRKHYDAAREGHTLSADTPKPQSQLVNKKTVAWLCAIYLEGLQAQIDAGRASPLTMKQRSSMATRLMSERSEGHNSKGTAFAGLHMEIPTTELIKLRDRMIEKPGQTANMFKFLRAMYSWGVERGYCDTNPAAGIKVDYKSKGGATPWSLDDLKQFRDRHPLGTPAHLCLSLYMFTACRISDVYRLGRHNEYEIEGLPWIGGDPAKRDASRVDVPILPPLQNAIREMKVVGPTYLLSVHGRPYRTMDSMRTRFARWCDEANLKGRTSHGIRKAAGHLLSLHGATQYEIMAVHGHANASTSEIYTKGVERQRLAASAIMKMEGLKW